MMYFVSYPKCGRTWIRVALFKYLKEKYDLASRTLSIGKLTRDLDLEELRFTHLGVIFTKNGMSGGNNPIPKKIILFVRNPKDTLISCYFHNKFRGMYNNGKGLYTGNVHMYVRGNISHLVRFYNRIFRRKSRIRKVLYYKEMHTNPEYVLQSILELIGEDPIDDECIQKAIEFSKFDNMKNLEMNDYFGNSMLRSTNKDNPKSYKCRKGKPENYMEYLGKKDIQAINSYIRKYSRSDWI